MIGSRTLFILGLGGLAGCASLVSAPAKDEPDKGLVYYLPKRDFVITLTVSDTGVQAVNVERTTAYPDGAQRFLLRYGRNLVGRNVLEVGVSSSGLLKSAKSTTTSNLADALKELASVAGAKSIASIRETQDDCVTPGVYSWVVAPTEASAILLAPCNLTASIRRLIDSPSAGSIEIDDDNAISGRDGARKQERGAYRAGVYYRNEVPYLVTVTSPAPLVQRAFLVSSPSESALRYLPIERTLFSDNDATLTFEDGVPTAYNQTADGELIGLLEAPGRGHRRLLRRHRQCVHQSQGEPDERNRVSARRGQARTVQSSRYNERSGADQQGLE